MSICTGFYQTQISIIRSQLVCTNKEQCQRKYKTFFVFFHILLKNIYVHFLIFCKYLQVFNILVRFTLELLYPQQDMSSVIQYVWTRSLLILSLRNQNKSNNSNYTVYKSLLEYFYPNNDSIKVHAGGVQRFSPDPGVSPWLVIWSTFAYDTVFFMLHSCNI